MVQRKEPPEFRNPGSAMKSSEGLQALNILDVSDFPVSTPFVSNPVEDTPPKKSYATNPEQLERTEDPAYQTLRLIAQLLNLRTPIKSDADLVDLVNKRLPLRSITALVEHGLQEKEIYSLVLPRRTLQHRRSRKEKLTCDESDRALRVARLAALAERVFGGSETSMNWLRAKKNRFAGRTPMEMMTTEAGSRMVEEWLYQIDEGMAA
ncbi:MAG TPA: antitoxin Xre/MbcA/ParS toxin-binding domain-containing protein [Candidatus Angelobacter sp.]|jgi:putative toxin-antitoxin system antitoxin component (TIGR02293 family)|nr:antitoxin Xre/MbcA/ParS toxin-binding domain-containing protein [Candidatus Angelobacter sp.]